MHRWIVEAGEIGAKSLLTCGHARPLTGFVNSNQIIINICSIKQPFIIEFILQAIRDKAWLLIRLRKQNHYISVLDLIYESYILRSCKYICWRLCIPHIVNPI